MSSVKKERITRVPKVSEETKEYVVEKILARRMRNRKVQYYLKWKDFDESENSWEMAENLNCKQLISSFETKRAKSTLKLKANTNSERSLRTRKTLNVEAVGVTKTALEESETDKENAEEIKGKSIKPLPDITEDVTKNNGEEKDKPPTPPTITKLPDIQKTTSKSEEVLLQVTTNETKIPQAESAENSKSFEILNDRLLVTDFLTRSSVQTGFDRGLEVQKIIGATMANGCLHLVIKFHDDDEPHLIVAEVANQKIPQMVIKFYEDSLSWDSGDEQQ